MNRFLSFIALSALFTATGARAQTNHHFAVPEDELTVIVNGKEVTGEEKKARLLEQEKMESEIRLKGAGIGAVIKSGEDGLPVVVKVFPDSPAAKAGLTQRDVITTIDHELTKGLAFTNVISRLRGEAGSTVTVTVTRLELAQPLEMKITREQIKYTPVAGEPETKWLKEIPADYQGAFLLQSQWRQGMDQRVETLNPAKAFARIDGKKIVLASGKVLRIKYVTEMSWDNREGERRKGIVVAFEEQPYQWSLSKPIEIVKDQSPIGEICVGQTSQGTNDTRIFFLVKEKS